MGHGAIRRPGEYPTDQVHNPGCRSGAPRYSHDLLVVPAVGNGPLLPLSQAPVHVGRHKPKQVRCSVWRDFTPCFDPRIIHAPPSCSRRSIQPCSLPTRTPAAALALNLICALVFVSTSITTPFRLSSVVPVENPRREALKMMPQHPFQLGRKPNHALIPPHP